MICTLFYTIDVAQKHPEEIEAIEIRAYSKCENGRKREKDKEWLQQQQQLNHQRKK